MLVEIARLKHDIIETDFVLVKLLSLSKHEVCPALIDETNALIFHKF